MGKRNKSDKIEVLEGQLDIFSLVSVETMKVSATLEIKPKVVEHPKAEEVSENIHHTKLIYEYKKLSITKQIVKHCGGGLLVELEENGIITTLYFNKDGEKEFQWEKQIKMLPWDKLVYERSFEVEQQEHKAMDIKEMQKSVKVGDVVEVKIKDKVFNAKVIRIYGGYNETLSILWDNKHTAVSRLLVQKIIKVA